MSVGQIIRFYRQKIGLTQEELGRGICTLSYISKIELEQTAYSHDIIKVISDRLNIDIEKEVALLENMENQLNRWHKFIIMQKMDFVEAMYKEFERIPFLNSTEYAAYYTLLKARYYILKKDYVKTYSILQSVKKIYQNLPPFEKNLQLHVWGIYYIETNEISLEKDTRQAINILKEIDIDKYRNDEYYYHIARANHLIQNKTMAYAQAEKALRHFKDTKNFKMALETEAFMLAQIHNDKNTDIKQIEESYYNLIQECDLLNAVEIKEILLGNLSFVYWRRKDYIKAQRLCIEALNLVEKPSAPYLKTLRNYLILCQDGKLIKKTEALRMAHKGRSVAKQMNNMLYQILFKIITFRIEDKKKQYYEYIEVKALPYFQSANHLSLLKKYAMELYEYYLETAQYENAAKISNILVEL
ncbi:helix-turn-helix domain-containing protein [Bacillus sp. AFS041924]|uniref:helix-turn-helix domain-containing protein n=1 Tax=Bacillus sp. AFS041924 TaxID=2033503 RepID=UPI000BFD4E2A|nr:helix-turn-helix transcriptional regulator [Bacillus sp. AFS041924]PGS54461.1 hypothetical protein COC46_05215 [Bacillus sp. AFS041924]